MTRTQRSALATVAVVLGALTFTSAPAVAHDGHDHSPSPSSEEPAPSGDAPSSNDAPADDTHDHGAMTLRDYARVWHDATKAQRKAATELIDATRAAAARWDDVNVALAEGYVARRGGIGAVHYASFANRRDGAVLDPEHPESLVYLQRPNGDPILLGVVYIVNRFEDRPTPAGALAAWHVHGVPGCHHPDLDPGCSDVRGGMLHVWLYGGVVDPFADPMFASMGSPEAWRTKLLELAGIDRRQQV